MDGPSLIYKLQLSSTGPTSSTCNTEYYYYYYYYLQERVLLLAILLAILLVVQAIMHVMDAIQFGARSAGPRHDPHNAAFYVFIVINSNSITMVVIT